LRRPPNPETKWRSRYGTKWEPGWGPRSVVAKDGLAVAIGGLINVFAPDVFAVGGQIAKAGELLLAPARKAARNTAIPSLFQDSRIVQAEQIEDAGILGAAALAMEAI